MIASRTGPRDSPGPPSDPEPTGKRDSIPSALMRTVTFASLFIAFFLVFLPAGILRRFVAYRQAATGVGRAVALALLLVGGVVALWCVFSFALIGRGTPAPFDPPRRLVVRGPYRYVRNPMYLGAGAALAGVALYSGSRAVLAYAALFLFVAHVFVVAYEEPGLRRRFGPEYDAYRGRVRRWIPWLRADGSKR